MKKILTSDSVKKVMMPDNVRIGLMIADYRKKCEGHCKFDYLALAFGQSPFNLPDPMVKSLVKNANKGHYSAASGILELRKAIAEFNRKHFQLDIDPGRIVIGNGTKDIIFTLLNMLKGAIVLPSPSWIGYKPQADFLQKRSYIFKLRPEKNYHMQAEDLDLFFEGIDEEQIIFLFNNPNNPTGVVYSYQELKAIAEVCRKHDALVISDEIYALSTYDKEKFVSMASVYPEGTFVTNGISKDRSAGGWRLGHCILPSCCSTDFTMEFTKIAATFYTNVSTPIQFACIEAYKDNKGIENYMDITRNIHRMMGNFLSKELNQLDGITSTIPEGGFYLYMDFNALKIDLKRKGVLKSNDLAHSLLAHPFHIAVVTGDANMIDENDFGARLAFVDYSGENVYKAFKKKRPKSENDERKFIEKYAPHIFNTKAVFEDWLKWVKS